jgi:hypothetical protein
LGNKEKDPGLSSSVRTHRGICWGTARRTLGFTLQSELIAGSVGEQREGPWIFHYSQNSSRNLLGNSEKDLGISSTNLYNFLMTFKINTMLWHSTMYANLVSVGTGILLCREY